MTRLVAVVAVAVAISLGASACADDDGGDGATPSVGTAAPDLDGTVAWSRSFSRAGDPAPDTAGAIRTDVLAATGEGVLVVSGPTAAFSDVSVAVVDPADGDVVWSQVVGIGLRGDVIGVVDDVVVVVGRESGAALDTVYGFDLVDGEQRWTHEAPAVTVHVVEGLVVIGSTNATTTLEPSTGVAVWEDPLRTPLGEVGPGLLSVRLSNTDQPSLALVEMATGETRWTLDVGEEAVTELRAMLTNVAAELLVAPEILPLLGADGSVRALDPVSGGLSAPLPIGLPSAGATVVELIAVGRPDEVVVCSGDENRVRVVGLELVAGQVPGVLYDRIVPAFEVGATSFTPQIADPGIRRLVLTGGARRPCRPDAEEGLGGLAVLDSMTGEVLSSTEGLDRVVLDSQRLRPGLNPPVSTLVAVRETDQDSTEITWALVDLQSGDTRWRVIDTVPTRTLSIVAGAVLVWEAETSTVGELDPVTGELDWVVSLTDVDPAGERTASADAERVYLGFGDRLVAVD